MSSRRPKMRFNIYFVHTRTHTQTSQHVRTDAPKQNSFYCRANVSPIALCLSLSLSLYPPSYCFLLLFFCVRTFLQNLIDDKRHHQHIQMHVRIAITHTSTVQCSRTLNMNIKIVVYVSFDIIGGV